MIWSDFAAQNLIDFAQAWVPAELDFSACQSLEKLVIGAKIIRMGKRLLKGIEVHTDTLATVLFEDVRF